MIAFVIGLLVGACVGLVITSMIFAVDRADALELTDEVKR
jgi:gas vesicle protein